MKPDTTWPWLAALAIARLSLPVAAEHREAGHFPRERAWMTQAVRPVLVPGTLTRPGGALLYGRR